MDKLRALKLTVQPYTIVVGASYTLIADYYVIINNHIYKTYSVLNAMAFVFKAFQAINAEYCKHIWMIIERFLYKIDAYDMNIPKVLTILNDLENMD